MPSDRWFELRDQIKHTRRYFLPAKFEKTGLYNERMHERAKGFRLLAHAELEAFFEDRLHEVMKEAKRRWDKDRESSKPIIAVSAYCHVGTDYPERDFNPDDALERRIEKSVNVFMTRVRNNHGIKRENLVPIFKMVGIEESDLDPIFLNDLDSFGAARGEIAHQTGTRIKTLLDPKTEWERVKSLVRGAREFDHKTEKLRVTH